MVVRHTDRLDTALRQNISILGITADAISLLLFSRLGICERPLQIHNRHVVAAENIIHIFQKICRILLFFPHFPERPRIVLSKVIAERDISGGRDRDTDLLRLWLCSVLSAFRRTVRFFRATLFICTVLSFRTALFFRVVLFRRIL